MERAKAALEERLDEELRQFSSWRFGLMGNCAAAVAGFNKVQKERYLRYIMEMEYY